MAQAHAGRRGPSDVDKHGMKMAIALKSGTPLSAYVSPIERSGGRFSICPMSR